MEFQVTDTTRNKVQVAIKPAQNELVQEEKQVKDAQELTADNFTPQPPVEKKALGTKENDSKFSWGQALKKFGLGIAKPFIQMIKNPAETFLAISAGIVLAGFFPVTIKLMLATGVCFGIYELGRGVFSAISGIKEKNWDKVENSFEDIGSGITSLSFIGSARGFLSRTLKLCGKATKGLMKETAKWYRGIYLPELKKLKPAALIFGGVTVVDSVHVVHSAVKLNSFGILLGIGIFAISKYVYMAFYYRKPIIRVVKLFSRLNDFRKKVFRNLRNLTKEFASQTKEYIFRGNHSSNPIGALAEEVPDHKLQEAAVNRLNHLKERGKLEEYLAHLMDMLNTNPKELELLLGEMPTLKTIQNNPVLLRAILKI